MAATDKPAKNAPIDLDALEAETTEESDDERFTVTVDGEPVHFTSILDLPWDEVEEVSQSVNQGRLKEFFYAVIEDGDELNRFWEARYRPKTIERLLNDYFQHIGYDPRRGTLNREARRRKGKRGK